MKFLLESNGFGYIYKITNNVNGKIYVGKTKSTIPSRFNQHTLALKKYIENGKKSVKLYNAMAKYGIENFSIEEIEKCPFDTLSEREIFWINELDSRNSDVGYNICKGGECGPGGPMFAGHKHTEETKQKMSADRTGSKNSNYGNRWNQSDELKKKHSELSSGENNGMYGKTHTDDSKLKNRLSHIGRKRMSNDEIYPNFKTVSPDLFDDYLKNGWYFYGDKKQ
jgi:group I intron endonuclease